MIVSTLPQLLWEICQQEEGTVSGMCLLKQLETKATCNFVRLLRLLYIPHVLTPIEAMSLSFHKVFSMFTRAIKEKNAKER